MSEVEVKAKLRYLRIAPRKVRLVADLIRGKSVEEAQTILNFTIKKASQPILKLLKSAIASAKNDFQLEESDLYISKILVDEGPKLKRWIARAQGRADEIQKKTSHVTIILKGKKRKKKEEIKKEVKKEPQIKEKIQIKEKPKFKPEFEIEKPKIERGIKRIFKRKAF